MRTLARTTSSLSMHLHNITRVISACNIERASGIPVTPPHKESGKRTEIAGSLPPPPQVTGVSWFNKKLFSRKYQRISEDEQK